ncbi:MAG: bifunctional UDP-N-acetylglucosamine diphosphorylase/glucosamine-1-phosphate N-acetyltransferase GlmU [Anaerolineales bacterium]
MMTTRGVILAAGLGLRMKSETPKVLHPLGERALIHYVLEAVTEATGSLPTLVIGPGADRIREEVGSAAQFVVQEESLGTAHAVRQVKNLLAGQAEYILIAYGDMPLLTAPTLRNLTEAAARHPGPLTFLVARGGEARGFGRVLRDPLGRVRKVVEEALATPEELAIQEINLGVYCVREAWLWEALTRIGPSPKGEYYLTDLVELASESGAGAQAILVPDPDEGIGINTRVHLAQAEAALRRRTNQRWMEAGVTLFDPATTYIGPRVDIGADTVILPNTQLEGETRIGRDCRIGPNTVIRQSSIGSGCRIEASVLEQATLEEQVQVGPFAHLRSGAHLASGVHMGNFGEVKNSYLGPRTKMGHFSYLGDAKVGAEANLGAGMVTCNFDGQRKNPTEIGEGAFIGSDTMLVAPIRVGKGARTGAGSVVTRDVPDGTLAVGAPARQMRRLQPREK